MGPVGFDRRAGPSVPQGERMGFLLDQRPFSKGTNHIGGECAQTTPNRSPSSPVPSAAEKTAAVDGNKRIQRPVPAKLVPLCSSTVPDSPIQSVPPERPVPTTEETCTIRISLSQRARIASHLRYGN
jgi:hypothetical protein